MDQCCYRPRWPKNCDRAWCNYVLYHAVVSCWYASASLCFVCCYSRVVFVRAFPQQTKHAIRRETSVRKKNQFFGAWCSGNIFFKSRLRHFSCRILQSYNSPGDWARELFKPSTDSASLVVEIEKNNFRFRWRFFWRRRHKEDMFWKSRPLLAGPGPQPIDKSIIWPFRSNFGRP